jgi:integrase
MNRSLRMLTLAKRYLDHRRRLGFRLSDYERDLFSFAKYCDLKASGEPITTGRAVEWASLTKASPAAQASRLARVRIFAMYCANLDPRTEVPSSLILGRSASRSRPHIFTHAEIVKVMLRARRLRDTYSPLRPHTYETLVGLMACTGMRPSEVRRLKLRDFNAESGTIRVPAVKTSPERVLPLHPTAVAALKQYLVHRRRLCPMGDYFFVGPIGRPLGRTNHSLIMQRLFRSIKSNGVRRAVRPYDLRHTFATNLIAKWSKEEAPVAHRLLLLARYLGHTQFTHTWWYVSGNADALRSAAKQFEQYIKAEPEDDL